MRAIVAEPDFLDNNYLSTDMRVPVTLLQTNACSPLATNAIADNIWDNFSSHTYKELPSVGTVTWYQPVTGEPRTYQMPAGGRGYTRPASLISAWSTAPFLQNNTVGKFNASPSVQARMDSFQDSIEKMLWPEKRDKDPVLGDKVPGVIDRTTQTSYLPVPSGFLPVSFRPLLSPAHRLLPAIFGEEDIVIGPIPKGTPISLLANLDLLGEGLSGDAKIRHQEKVLALLIKMKHDLAAFPKMRPMMTPEVSSPTSSPSYSPSANVRTTSSIVDTTSGPASSRRSLHWVIPRSEHSLNSSRRFEHHGLSSNSRRQSGDLRPTKSYSIGVQLWSGLYVVSLDTAFAVLSPRSF